jgi:hypothetical protein
MSLNVFSRQRMPPHVCALGLVALLAAVGAAVAAVAATASESAMSAIRLMVRAARRGSYAFGANLVVPAAKPFEIGLRARRNVYSGICQRVWRNWQTRQV